MTDDTLQKTSLDEFHLSHGGKMVPFAGYSMPVQYPLGVMKEHVHTRTDAGLFDVSHMGQVILRPKSGNIEDAMLALERLVPMDVLALKPGRQRYGLFTNATGGISDDLMFANRGDHLFLVVNAACKDADIAYMQSELANDCTIEVLTDRGLLALQGPKAEAALPALAPEAADMKFMDVRDLTLVGETCIVSRSGYSGEDGYEISVPALAATGLAKALIAQDGVELIGLGARDSLRLEAGLCLYGNDLDPATNPVEASLKWAIQKARRSDGDREGGFPGADVILDQFANGAARKRIGVQPSGRAPMRGGAEIYASDTGSDLIGTITSGGFGPTVNGPIAMGYVTTNHATTGTEIFVEVRGKRLPATVADMPFITPTYKR